MFLFLLNFSNKIPWHFTDRKTNFSVLVNYEVKKKTSIFHSKILTNQCGCKIKRNKKQQTWSEHFLQTILVFSGESPMSTKIHNDQFYSQNINNVILTWFTAFNIIFSLFRWPSSDWVTSRTFNFLSDSFSQSLCSTWLTKSKRLK